MVDMNAARYEGLESQLMIEGTKRLSKDLGKCLTPGGILRPQKTAPLSGTTRGRLPGAPPETRKDSLMMPRW